MIAYVLKDVNGTDFEGEDDKPWGVRLEYSASNTRRKTFFVPGDEVSSFKIMLTNDSGASVTATVKTKQLDEVTIT